MEDSRRGSDRGRATRHPVGKRFWPISKAERREIKQLFETEEMSKLATMLRSRDDDAPVKLLDAAYWMKGCSSLGRLRYAVILWIGSKEAKAPRTVSWTSRKPHKWQLPGSRASRCQLTRQNGS